jgi:hypothetical protein
LQTIMVATPSRLREESGPEVLAELGAEVGVQFVGPPLADSDRP